MKPKVIPVPQVTHPTLCYKQAASGPHVMTHCVFAKGHAGPHSWDKAPA